MVKPVLIIDPGHGGLDGGGGTNEHWKEKDLVLRISLYQYERFKDLGVPVALTRDKDVYLSSTTRTNIVKQSGATYCLSNHINAGGGDGFEAIHSIYADGKLEKIMAEEIKKTGQNVRRIFTRTYTSNGKRYDYYFMHRETGKVITTIVEYGFADSKLDDVEQLLKNWEAYAEAIVKAYCIYLGYNYVAPKEEGELTLSQYNELKKVIENQAKEIDSLKKALNKKQDAPSKSDKPTKDHVDSWDWLFEKGITKGGVPQYFITREQVGTMLNRYYNQHEKLPDWMYDEMVEKFDHFAPYLSKPQYWKERLAKHDVEVPELLGMVFLALLNKEITKA